MTDIIDIRRRPTMTAKITLGKLATPAFTGTMQELLKKKLPVKTAWKVKTLVDKFNDELAKFNVMRKGLLEELCEKDENGSPKLDAMGNYSFDNESLKKVTASLTELTSIEIEFEPISVESLGNIDLTAQQLFDLGEVVQE